jgi:hypothetical protein
MFLHIALIVMKVLEFMFFFGLAGCLLTVVLSWISVGKASFSKDTDSDT